MVTVTTQAVDEIHDCTNTYLDQVETTVAHLPTVIETYNEDPDAFREATDQLHYCESECDATLSGLRTLLGESLSSTAPGPSDRTGIPIDGDSVVRLFDRIDVVPNRCERFADDLAVMEPDLADSTVDHLSEMATLVVEATTVLATATRACVDNVCSDDDSIRTTGQDDVVSRLESDCDDVRSAALSKVFATSETSVALVVRELLLGLDAAMDAVEDAAEHLLA